jgi:hypothetical protein
MKKLWILALVICLLAGCTAAEPGTTASTQAHQKPPATPTQATDPTSTAPTSPEPSETAPTTPTTQPTDPPVDTTVTFLLYHPDEAWMGFETVELTIDTLDPHRIIAHLIEYGVLKSDVALNSAEVVDSQLNLDLNNAFLMQIYSMGALGEALLMGSLVNTFFSAYECESMMVTVDGEIIHSGHVDYDHPMYPSN